MPFAIHCPSVQISSASYHTAIAIGGYRGGMSTRLACVVFDADRPRSVAHFWAQLLGWPITLDRPDEVDVAAPGPNGPGPTLIFLPATHRKQGKNRIHLDVASKSFDHQELLADRARTLGARPVDIGQGTAPWTVLADPEGNEFCVLEPREEYVDTGALAAIVVDTYDPTLLAAFWSAASGWPVTRRGAQTAGLRAPSGLGVWLEFVHTGQPKTGRNRLRFDLATSPPADPEMEMARLQAAGATPIQAANDDWPGLELADPEANEFSLFTPTGNGIDR